MGPWLDRPLKHDEISQLNTTGAAFLASKKQMQSIPAGDVGTLVEGLGRGLGSGGWDPLNHVITSYAMSVSGFLFGYDSLTVRLPSFLTYLGSILLLFLICRRWSRSTAVAWVLSTLIIFHPMIFFYSVSARGYSFMIFLLLLQVYLLLEKRFYRSDWGLLAVWVCAMLHYAQFLNMVSTAFLWIAPFCLGVLLFPPRHILELKVLNKFQRPDRAFRVFWSFSCIPAVVGCFTFILIHIRSFLLSQEKYGSHLEHHDGWLTITGEVFPGLQSLLLILGGAALVLAIIKLRSHWFVWTVVIMLAFIFLYSAISGKVMWPRNYISLAVVIPLLLALVYPVLFHREQGKTRRIELAGQLSLLMLAGVIILGSATRSVAFINPLPNHIKLFGVFENTDFQSFRRSGHDQLIVSPWIYRIYFYLPEEEHWKDIEVPAEEATPLDLFLFSWTGETKVFTIPEGFELEDGQWLLRVLYWDRALQEHHYWRVPPGWAEEILAESTSGFLRIATTARKYTDPSQLTEDSIIIWAASVPNLDQLEIIEDLKNEVDDYMEVKAALQYDSQHHPLLLIFPDSATTPQHRMQIAQAASDLWGGQISLAQPQQRPAATASEARDEQ